MLKINWKVANTDLLKRIREKEPCIYACIYDRHLLMLDSGHVLRGSGGRNALVILEGELNSEKQKVDRRECGLTTSGSGQC